MKTPLLRIALLLALPLAPVRAQQPNPLGGAQADTAKTPRQPNAGNDSSPASGGAAAGHRAPAGFEGVDSVVYRLDSSSRLEVKTGKAGLFGFAGHSHVIRARAFSGDVVYYPHAPARSHLRITVQTDSLEVLTPPDTAEIRKVTAAMRTETLHTDQYHEIRLITKEVTPTANGFHLIGAFTLAGQTRDVPMDVSVEAGVDTLRAEATFAIKQTDYGIKPFSGGPGGTVKVADKVTFDIHAIAVRALGHRGEVAQSSPRRLTPPPRRVARGPTPMLAPGTAQLQARPEPRDLSGAGDAGTPFERLPGPLEPDQPKILQRGYAGVVEEQPQQVALGRMADRRQRGHVPVPFRPGDDGILHPVHDRVQMAPMHQKGRQFGVTGRAPQVHHHVLRDAGGQRLAALLGNQV